LLFQALDIIHKLVGPKISMKNIVLLVLLSSLIQGCTSISQPTASTPLVENALKFFTSTAFVDFSLSEALFDLKTGAKLVIEQQPAVMGDKYFAATGNTCRKLTLEKLGQRTYCLNNLGSWYKVKRVISEYNEDKPEDNL
jgi:hypothetical protein